MGWCGVVWGETCCGNRELGSGERGNGGRWSNREALPCRVWGLLACDGSTLFRGWHLSGAANSQRLLLPSPPLDPQARGPPALHSPQLHRLRVGWQVHHMQERLQGREWSLPGNLLCQRERARQPAERGAELPRGHSLSSPQSAAAGCASLCACQPGQPASQPVYLPAHPLAWHAGLSIPLLPLLFSACRRAGGAGAPS